MMRKPVINGESREDVQHMKRRENEEEAKKNYHQICLVVFRSHLCARMNEPVVVHSIGIMQASLC